MTIYNKTSLQSFFQQGDVPTGTNYADFIDSCVNMAETVVQAIAGPINPTELIAAQVSAGNGVFTGNVRIDGTLSAATISLNDISVSSVTATTVSAGGNISTLTGSVYASAGRFANGVYQGVAVISAAGTTQATAALLTAVINNGKGIVDGTTTGYAIPANRTGWVQYLLNEGASANLWPPTGGKINGLAVNTPFPVAASASYTIIHFAASAYGVN